MTFMQRHWNFNNKIIENSNAMDLLFLISHHIQNNYTSTQSSVFLSSLQNLDTFFEFGIFDKDM
jgi:hypothetical protein